MEGNKVKGLRGGDPKHLERPKNPKLVCGGGDGKGEMPGIVCRGA
jgi:hypothetical protein